jgi:DNA polymerase
MSKETLQTLSEEIAKCRLCRLSESRTHAVPGEGNQAADVVFVGEGPGKFEDAEGRPFVGMAGRYLDRLLGGIGWSREQVYITNIIKCRPPDNRDPRPDEVAACRPYLERQLEVIRPRLVVTLGRHALGWFLPGEKISRVHGEVVEMSPYALLPLYHPSAAIRFRERRLALEEAFKRIPEVLERLG